MTTTATPFSSMAARIAICNTRGADSAVVTSSQYTLHSRNSSCGRVSWKYCEPISDCGMCAAMASTGTRLRCASKSPLIRCRLPGPQLPAQTASRLVRAASAAAAKPAVSSWRTCSQLKCSARRMASVRPLRLSPGSPYMRVMPLACSVEMT